MEIQYFDPLSRAWERMKKALFKPFDLKKWFVIGFTAFLSALTDCHGGGRGNTGWHEPSDMDTFMTFPGRAREWIMENPGWVALILAGGIVITLIVIVLTWISSRGKFMFLDNVVHDRAQVVAPWHEYRAEGNSLFLWRFVFGLAVLGVFGSYLVACFTTLYTRYEELGDSTELLGPIILMILGLAAMLVIVAYVSLFLTDFVVPIMYRNRCTAFRAWGIFLRLFSVYPLQLIAYGLLMLFLVMILVAAIILGGLLTCCIGFLILVIPYVNEVLLLPVTYTLRAFSVEFLEQFGPDYQVFPRPAPPQPAGGAQQP